MPDVAKAAINANKHYLETGLHYAELDRQHTAATRQEKDQYLDLNLDLAFKQLEIDLSEADTQWRLARRNVHVAFGNFAAGFYRMMSEPVNQQHHVTQLNNLLIQNHVLASQISAAIPLLAALSHVPEGINSAINAIKAELNHTEAEPVRPLETAGELAMLAYPLRQMLKASQQIKQQQLDETPTESLTTPLEQISSQQH